MKAARPVREGADGKVLRATEVTRRRPTLHIRERTRELGMSLKELAKLAGVSCGYLSDVARGRKCMSPAVQARVEALLEGPARVESAPIPGVDCRALWDRMDAHGYSCAM